MDQSLPILLADDETEMLRFYGILLKREGLHFIATPDPFEALHICQTQPLALMVSDIAKRDMDGIELLKKVRVSLSKEQLPIFIVSNLDRERENVLQQGANSFMKKPILAGAFMAELRRLLEA